MPELPEVEVIVNDLRSVLVGRTISQISVRREEIVTVHAEAALDHLTYTQIAGVSRVGKYIVIHVRETPEVLIVHLGMTGHLRVMESVDAAMPHVHLVIHLVSGGLLVYDDARRFGRVLFGSFDALRDAGSLPILGIDPLRDSLTGAAIASICAGRKRSIKGILLDQQNIAGLGNIYTDEICFAACIAPARSGGSLTFQECTALAIVTRAVLEDAIANRGSSIDDYRDVWNAKGKQQEVLRVYGRAGLPCVRCGTTLTGTRVSTRGTSYCSRCQR